MNRGKIYYGWFVVAAVFFILMMTMGARVSLGVFVMPMSEEFGWSRGIISFAGALAILVNGLSQPFMGYAYDKFGGRKLFLWGVLFIGLSVVLLAITFHFLYFVLVLAVLMAVAMSAGSITTGAVLVSKWFQRNRATAISVSSSGASAGGLILVPFATYLVILIDWRLTWVVLGGLILVVVLPLAILLLKNDPAEIGLLPDGDEIIGDGSAREGREESGPLAVDNWIDAFRSVPMWQLCISYFVCGFTTLLIAFHFVPYTLERGFSPATAATAFGFLSAMNTIGVLAVGPLADRLGKKNLLGFLYALRGFGYICLLFLPGQLGLWAFAFLAGASWIATVPPTTALTADLYGLKKIGTLSGVAFMSHQIGGSIGIQFGGIARDITGSYDASFIVSVLLLVFASIISFTIQERKYSVRYQSINLSPTPSPH